MKMSEPKDAKSIVILVLYAIALAVGVFGVVIPIVSPTFTADTVLNLFGIAIFCLGLAGIMSRQ
jgi:uncharacterized membrane protein